MSIKFGEINDAQMFYQDSDGEYTLGEIEGCELTVSADEFNHEPYCLLGKSMELTATISSSNTKALWIFLTTGNDLYLKFPKKLRRRKRKSWTSKKNKNTIPHVKAMIAGKVSWKSELDDANDLLKHVFSTIEVTEFNVMTGK